MRIMVILLCLALALSALILFAATAMEAGAIRQNIQGANGFVLFVALYVSAFGSVVVAGITWIAWGFPEALAVLAFSALWHWGAFRLTAGGLDRMASRVTAGQAKR